MNPGFHLGLTETAIQAEDSRDCLSWLVAQVAAQSELLTALRTHKMGLMQQFFPSAGEGEA